MTETKKSKRRVVSDRLLDLPVLPTPQKPAPKLIRDSVASSVPRLPSITPRPDINSALQFSDVVSSKRSLFDRKSQSLFSSPMKQHSKRLPPGGVIRDFGNAAHQGGRHNQDAWILARDVRPGLHLVGIFDGHGPYGHDVSTYLREQLVGFILESVGGGNKEELIEGLKEGFKTASNGVRKAGVDYTYSGSTCLTVLLQGHMCLCAHVGDSRAVLGRRVVSEWRSVAISTDHSPELREESARIISAGGVISSSCTAVPSTGPLRVWLKNQRIPGLAMTRSIGDALAQRVGVISLPDITDTSLTCEHKLLVAASDGLWTVMTNEEVVQHLGRSYDSGASASRAAEWLLREALRRWERKGESDDVTLQVVFFE